MVGWLLQEYYQCRVETHIVKEEEGQATPALKYYGYKANSWVRLRIINITISYYH